MAQRSVFFVEQYMNVFNTLGKPESGVCEISSHNAEYVLGHRHPHNGGKGGKTLFNPGVLIHKAGLGYFGNESTSG